MTDIPVRHWADAISNSKLSGYFQDALWVVPTSQSIHIVCVSIVFACALMISLRLLGVSHSGRSVSQLVDSLTPWMYRALAVLLLTGTVQTIAEPMRQFVTPAFWWKMFMIVCVVSLTIWFTRAVRRNAGAWDAAAKRPTSAKIFALLSLALWIGIIYCGRFIGYTWELHV
jgi:small-conductance mechanosensitive channel